MKFTRLTNHNVPIIRRMRSLHQGKTGNNRSSGGSVLRAAITAKVCSTRRGAGAIGRLTQADGSANVALPKDSAGAAADTAEAMKRANRPIISYVRMQGLGRAILRAAGPDFPIELEPDFDRAEVFVAVADIGADASALFPRLFECATEAHIVPGVFDASIFKLALRSVGGVPLITLRSGALTGLEGALKRAFDIAVAALLLALVAPLMTIIALLIKVSSPGPVFFRQERVGKGGCRIQIYKFRTMHQDAEDILK